MNRNFYVKIVNGIPTGNPLMGETIISVAGTIPNEWEEFKFINNIHDTPYTVKTMTTNYEKIDGIWYYIAEYRDMTAEEKLEAQNTEKEFWANRPFAHNFTAWTYDETQNKYVPPIPRPASAPEGQMYRWSGVDNNWKLAPEPVDKDVYHEFDFDKWEYINPANNVAPV